MVEKTTQTKIFKYTYNMFDKDVKKLADRIKENKWDLKYVYGPPRGGCVIAVFLSHYLDLKPSQFYNLELQKSESVKDAIHRNKSKGASYLLNKFIASDNPTLQISAFKIICSDEQRKKLSMQFVESENKHEIKEFTVRVIDNNPDGNNHE